MSLLQAFSPHYWFAFCLRNMSQGWRVLSGVLLAATGTEALFADIGHFSQRSIQLAFCLVVVGAACATALSLFFSARNRTGYAVLRYLTFETVLMFTAHKPPTNCSRLHQFTDHFTA